MLTSTRRSGLLVAMGLLFMVPTDSWPQAMPPASQEQDLKKLEDDMEKAGAPWTPGHVPEWIPQ